MEASVTATPQDARSEHEDNHEYEATEMNHYNGAERSDDLLTPLPEEAPATATGTHERYSHMFRKSVKTFWERQIRATVAHEACRDHFGTRSFSSNPACFRFNTITSVSSAVSSFDLVRSCSCLHISIHIHRPGSWQLLTHLLPS